MKDYQELIKNLVSRLDQSNINLFSLEEGKDSLEENLKKEIIKIPIQKQERIYLEFFENGPLKDLFDDDEITEIIINSWDKVWYEKNGQFFLHHDAFLSLNTFENYLHKLCKRLKTQLTFETPFLCVMDGPLRYHITSPTITGDSYSLSIRKHRENRLSLEGLTEIKSISPQQLQLLKNVLEEKKNFLVIGATGSGKTTFLNACLQSLKNNERALIIEDTSELITPNNLSTKILTRKDSHNLTGVIDLSILIKEALRMRPDRIILGEVRGAEAKDLLLALSTGHEGSIGTLHARSATEALLRLEMLIQLGSPQWSLEAIRKLIYLSVHYIFTIERRRDGSRGLKSIHRLCGVESFGVLTEEIKS